MRKIKIFGLIIIVLFLFFTSSIPSYLYPLEKDQTEDASGQKDSKYKGEKGDFIFNNADLKNVLLFFARTYHFNIILEPGISGKVTCHLINVPWDQAFDLILRQHGLASVEEKNNRDEKNRNIKISKLEH